MTVPLPPRGRCTACGQEFGAEPHLITLAPDGVHLGCRDWSRVPWPYDRLLHRLRSRYRALRLALGSVERFGGWLADRRRHWPGAGANTMLEVTRRTEELKRALERAGFRWPSGP